MRHLAFQLTILVCLLIGSVALADDAVLPDVPPLAREYRGVWVATVANIDWPTKPGLTSAEQQNQAIKILDTVAAARMNVVVLQIRTSCDALYASKLEPWSYFLTGRQGQAPEPFYDPLEFWIEQAHSRGLELHAWFNPFRAKNSGQTYDDCPEHISQAQPSLVKEYGNEQTRYKWLDPGENQARQHSMSVFLDVLQRYDVDGIHIDDYFYPYPVDDIPFPDDPAWNAYRSGGGTLARDDWRRDSMNRFIRELYAEIKRIKPHVKFGISPFGIWKPGYPSSVAGFSQHDKLYADARLWLNEGWCDYYSPQLYWAISAKQQSFPALLNWWIGENRHHRHMVPGIYTGRIGNKTKPFSAEEIVSQTYLAKHTPGSHGVVHFSMKTLLENREQIASTLTDGPYADVAVTPALSWLSNKPPKKPELTLQPVDSQLVLSWKLNADKPISRCCLRTLAKGQWSSKVISGKIDTLKLANAQSDISAVALSVMDRFGNESDLTVVKYSSK